MKEFVVILALAAIAYIGYAEWSEWHFQAFLLESSDLKLARSDVDLELEAEHSSHFGADSVIIYGFAANDRESLLEECGKNGYSEAQIIDPGKFLGLSDMPLDQELGCFRRRLTKGGATQIFVLLERMIFVKNMS